MLGLQRFRSIVPLKIRKCFSNHFLALKIALQSYTATLQDVRDGALPDAVTAIRHVHRGAGSGGSR